VFTRVTACTLAGSPGVIRYIEGFSHFVTSIAAPTASGWSEIAGWDSHPLENAAFARRTPTSDIGLTRGAAFDRPNNGPCAHRNLPHRCRAVETDPHRYRWAGKAAADHPGTRTAGRGRRASADPALGNDRPARTRVRVLSAALFSGPCVRPCALVIPNVGIGVCLKPIASRDCKCFPNAPVCALANRLVSARLPMVASPSHQLWGPWGGWISQSP